MQWRIFLETWYWKEINIKTVMHRNMLLRKSVDISFLEIFKSSLEYCCSVVLQRSYMDFQIHAGFTFQWFTEGGYLSQHRNMELIFFPNSKLWKCALKYILGCTCAFTLSETSNPYGFFPSPEESICYCCERVWWLGGEMDDHPLF